ncbi:MAG: methyltransferase family protein [Candidatus Nanopelagicales bacterium]
MTKARLFVLAQFGLLAVLVLLPTDPAVTAPSWFRPLSIALLGLAFLILFLAAISLRPALTASPVPKHSAPLIQSGIYRYVRHPMYSAVITVGAAVMLGNPTLLTMIVWVALIIVLFNKAHYEDQLLLAKHPSAKDYQSKVGAFVPKLSRN